MKSNKQIYIVSDSAGVTTEMAVNFALSQFSGAEVEVNRVTMVRDKAALIEVVHSAKETDGLIVYTFVSEDLRIRGGNGCRSRVEENNASFAPRPSALCSHSHKPSVRSVFRIPAQIHRGTVLDRSPWSRHATPSGASFYKIG